MTDNSNAAPERIWFTKVGNDIVPNSERRTPDDVEYTRADLARAQVAVAYERAAQRVDQLAKDMGGTGGKLALAAADWIRDDTPDDAKDTLDAMLKAERAKAYERSIDSLDYLLNDIDQGDAIRDAIRALAQENE